MPPTRPVRAALLATLVSATFAPRASGQACRVSGTAARFEVTVSPAGAPSFVLPLEGAAVTALPPARGTRSAIDVAGVLAFAAVADRVPYRAAAPVTVAGAVVELGDWAALSDVRARGGDAVLTADVGDGVAIRDLAVPCSALTVDPVPDRPAPLRDPPCAGEHWIARGQRAVTFFARPGAGPGVRLELARPHDGLIVCEVAQRGAWLRVATADTVHVDGARVTGWVARAALRGIAGGVGFTGGRSMPRPPPGGARGVVSGPGVHPGPARIDAGTRVYAARGAAPWATVRDDRAEIEVVVRDNDAWVELLRVPGLGAVTSAWVPRAAVHPRR